MSRYNEKGESTQKVHLTGNLFTNPLRTRYYVWTGEKRQPKAGEYYLSGAIPQVYRAMGDSSYPYHIMRPATDDETRCPTCGQIRQHSSV